MHAATVSSQRGAPAASLRRPTTLRNRQAPQSATGTASSRIVDTAAATLPPTRVARIASGSTYGGAGTAVPWPRACHDSFCRSQSSRAAAGAADRPPPLTGPMASRAPNSTSSTNVARPRATGLVRNLATRPVSSAGPSSSSTGVTRRGVTGWSTSAAAAAARRRSATSCAWRREGRDEVADRVEAVPVGQPPGRQQPAYVVLVGRASTSPFAAGGEHLSRAAVQRHEGGQLVERLSDGTHQQEADHPQQGAQPEAEHLPRQRPSPGVGQQRVHRGPALLVVRVPAGERRPADAAVRGLRVEDHRPGHHDRLVARRRGPPAEVDVVAEHRELLVEATELLEHRAADEHAGGVDGQHGADVVVLTLVVLAALQPGLPAAGAGDGHPDLEQPAQRGPLAQLGTEDVGLRVGLGRRQQRGQRVGGRVRVVVDDPDPVGVADVLEPQPDRDGERRRGRRPHDSAPRRTPTRGGRPRRPCCRCRRR